MKFPQCVRSLKFTVNLYAYIIFNTQMYKLLYFLSQVSSSKRRFIGATNRRRLYRRNTAVVDTYDYRAIIRKEGRFCYIRNKLAKYSLSTKKHSNRIFNTHSVYFPNNESILCTNSSNPIISVRALM